MKRRVDTVAVVNPYNYVRPDNSAIQGGVIMNNKGLRTRNAQSKQDAYLVQKVMTAKPQELTMMLYEGMVRFIKLSKYYLEKEDIEKTHDNSIKAQNIVKELQGTLNKEYEISEDLDKLYSFVYDELVAGNMEKDEVRFDNALEISKELCDTWREAMKEM